MSCIDLLRGYASHDLLPREEIISATSQLLAPVDRDFDDNEEDKHPLVYGTDQGSLWVRKCICNFQNETFNLDHRSRMVTKPEFLNLTTGASYGFMNILLQTTLPHTNYTRQAFIVTPTYFLINDAFLDAGFTGKLTAIEELDDGLDIAFLENRLQFFDSTASDYDDSDSLHLINAKNGRKKIYRYVLYLVPTFSNPGGVVYSKDCRMKLLALARTYDMLIISDDVYDLLSFDGSDTTPPELRFPHLDRETLPNGNTYGNTVSNCTFSKIVAPGLRTGYQETANENLAGQLSRGGANISGGTPSQLNSMIVGTMISNGSIKQIIQRMVCTLRTRSQILKKSVSLYLPRGSICREIRGGYFTWCTLPEPYDASEICKEAKDRGLLLGDGSLFEVFGDEKGWGKSSVRLCISFANAEEIEKAIKIWGTSCQWYIEHWAEIQSKGDHLGIAP
ncbi:LADA_0C12992g1_1 [Lachancea dasiensis]|uniref:LADA_0C12992g1_1 n=1 Tax=Lachancea dasiensis TaxID=1072105 RepID=A0A1G4J2M3_9SACH|nr:LADA_0C12992g1_1 [Lachancea dasiensis]